MISLSKLRELLDYNPETGEFRWKKIRGKKLGDLAGCIVVGYRRITVNGRQYRGGRLAWFYVHGVWPPDEIDHINGHRSDDRLINLRLATSSQNSQNQKLHSDNKSGLKGVYWDRNKWCAQIFDGQTLVRLGRFNSAKEAYASYRKAASKLFGEYARP